MLLVTAPTRGPPAVIVGLGLGDAAATCSCLPACSSSTRTKARCCSSSATTSARSRRRGCAGPTRSTRRSASRCASATSRARSSRSTTTTATRSRSPRSSSGGWSTPPRRCSRSTTTRTTCRCRARRRCATWRRSYPYDAHDDAHDVAARHTPTVAEHLKKEIQDRLAQAGVEVMEARISHLAYAPEIAAGDAAAPAGRRDHRGAPADRRGRGRHGGDGARDAVAARRSSSSTRSARRRW